jgi:tetraspanin-15
MRHRSGVKKILKISFVLIQTIIFISSICLSIISFTFYYKGHDLFNVKIQTIFMMISMSVLSFASSLVGFQAINSRKKLRLFSFILLTVILLNIQIVVSIKSSMLPEKSAVWGESMWDGMNMYQKDFVQKKFNCCGFRDKDDRPGLTCGLSTVGCFSVLYQVSLSLRSLIEKSVVFLFFIESGGLVIISLLKLRK